MVGVRSCREVRLDDVEPTHSFLRPMRVATSHEAACGAKHARLGLEEVTVQREDRAGAREVVDGVQ